MYRDALGQLTLFREMEQVCRASMLTDFRVEDLTPNQARMQVVLSAILNFGRFREDVLKQHSEDSGGLVKLEEELHTLNQMAMELQSSIKVLRERQAKEAPERESLLSEIERLEMSLGALVSEGMMVERAVEEEKKRIEESKMRYDHMSFDCVNIQRTIDDLKAGIVSSPKRIQAELLDQKKRLEQERNDLESQEEEEKTLLVKTENLTKAGRSMDEFFRLLKDVEEKMCGAKEAEEDARRKKTMIESHAFRVKELRQREQEALRELNLAEERNRRAASQRIAKLDAARHHLKQLTRDHENIERNAQSDERRLVQLRDESIRLRSQISDSRHNSIVQRDAKQGLFEDVLASFDAYVVGVKEGVEAVKEACAISSI